MKISKTIVLLISAFYPIRGAYIPAGNDLKCPFNSEQRLFRTDDSDPKTLEECHKLCYDMEGCKYFSIGVTDHAGVCMGCTEDARLSTHVGFVAYELTEFRQDFPSASPIAASSCIADGDTFRTSNGCDYESFIDGLNEFIAGTCGDHDAEAVLESIFGSSSEGADIVNGVCAKAWDQVPTSTFSDVDARFDDDFMEEYINGDTFLNYETGTFQGTEEGTNIDSFRDDQATNTVMQAIPSLSTCENNAIMCCFGRDRQPNDNNGNCADPIETNCRDADPGDNSNLCWTDTDIPTFNDPFTFPDKSEGPIHCHGLAWTDDDNSFEAQLRFNNLFFVSLYDHMYTRGYVETTVDSDNIGMCDCVENMPVVSRSDCTEVDVTQAFTVTYSNGSFTATKTDDMNVEFNACRGIDPSNGGRENNDLASYVYRLHQEGRFTDENMEGVFDTLVGYARPNDNQNEGACEASYSEIFIEEYPVDVAGFKCPFHSSDRLFRTDDNDPKTLEECQDICYNTQFCKYFSLGVSTRGDQKGVCMGCTDSAVLERHSGFNTYEMTTTQTFPTIAPTPEPDEYELVGLNKKCPMRKRLFRTNDNSPISKNECYAMCNNEPTCEYFTYGEDENLRDAWKGMCMGCTSNVGLSNHEGFNTYTIL